MLLSNIILSLFLISLIKTDDSKTIAVELKQFITSYYTFVKYGSDQVLLLLSTSVESDYSHQIDNLFKTRERELVTLVKENVTFPLNSTYSIIGDEYTEKMILRNDNRTEVNDIHMIVHPRDFNFITNSALAFAHKISDIKYSIVHSLKKEKIIDNLQFSFMLNDDKENGTLFIGGLPENISSEYPYKEVVPVSNKKSKYWEIKLDYIFFGEISYVYENKYIKNEYNARISTNVISIQTPMLIMEQIVNEQFNQSIAEKKCSVNYNNYEVQCNCNYINEFKDMIFVINSKEFKFKAKDLFIEQDDICTFAMTANNIDQSQWRIGIAFLEKFLVNFDYDNNEITFMSKLDNFIFVDLNTLFPYSRILKWILILIGLVVLFFVCRYGYRIYKKRKVLKLNKYITQVYTEF